MPVGRPARFPRRHLLTSVLAWAAAVAAGLVMAAITLLGTSLGSVRSAPERYALAAAAWLIITGLTASQARGPVRSAIARVIGAGPDGAAAPVTVFYAGADRVWAAWARDVLASSGAAAGTREVEPWQPGRLTSAAVLVAGPAFGLSSQAAECARRITGSYGRRGRWQLGAPRTLAVIRIDDAPLPGGLRADPELGLYTITRADKAREILLAALQRQHWQPPAPAGQQEPGQAARYPGEPAPWRIWRGMPPENAAFTGRTDLLDGLARALLSEQPGGREAGQPGGQPGAAMVRACVLQGLGGAGKSTLAVEFALRYRAYYAAVTRLVVSDTAADDELRGLAEELGVDSGDAAERMARTWEVLAARGRTLLILDNAADRSAVGAWWPPPGRDVDVLVTTHSEYWPQARLVPVGGLSPDAAVRLLLLRANSADRAGAARLAEKLGYLPLALVGAAAWVWRERSTFDSFGRRLEEKLVDAMRRAAAEDPGAGGRPEYPELTWEVCLDQARQQQPRSEQLMFLLAFLGPEGLPERLPTAHPEVLPPGLAAIAASEDAYGRAVGALAETALITADGGEIGVHRVVQAVMRGLIPAGERSRWAAAAARLVERSFPADPGRRETWPECGRLLPHALVVTGWPGAAEAAPAETAALCQRAAAYLAAVRARQEPALELLDRALDLRTRTAGSGSAGVAELLARKAQVLHNLARIPEARQAAAESVAIGERVSGPDSPALVPALRILADSLAEAGRGSEAAEAVRVLTRALAISEARPGGPNRETGELLGLLGYVHRRLGDYVAARDALTRALALWDAAGFPEPRHRVVALRRLGQVLQDMGDLDGALDRLEEAHRVALDTLGPDRVETVRAESALGAALGAAGQLDEAERLGRRAVDFFTTAHPAWQLREGAQTGLALTLVRAGKADEAVRLARQAVTSCEQHRRPGHSYHAETLAALGRAQHAQGDLAAAAASLERALAIYVDAYGGPGYPPAAAVRAELAAVRAERAGADPGAADPAAPAPADPAAPAPGAPSPP